MTLELLVWGVPVSTTAPDVDLSVLPNLPATQQAAVEAAARAANPSEPQAIIDEIAKTDWIDFRPVSFNLQKADSTPANVGESVQTIISVNGSTYTLLTGSGGQKTLTGLSVNDVSYSGAQDQNSEMTFVAVSSHPISTSTGYYYFDINTIGSANRRIFEAVVFSSPTRLGYFDGAGHQQSADVTMDAGTHIDSYVVNGSSIDYRRDGSPVSSGLVTVSPTATDAEIRIFGTGDQRFNGTVYGYFYAPSLIDVDMIESFASSYYETPLI